MAKDDKKDDKPATQPPSESEPTPEDLGYRGIEVDPTPNSAYTVAGVIADEPTPETDDEAAEKARLASQQVARRAAGVATR